MSEAKPLPRLARALPYVRLNAGLGIRPTFYGFVYMGMLLALLLGSINHNNNLGYLLTFLLSGLLLVSIRQTWRNVRAIDAGSGQAQPAFAGSQARFVLHVRANPQSRYGLQLTLDAGLPSSADLRAGQDNRVELLVPVEERGLLRCEQLAISSSFPFGLFECRQNVPVQSSCLVYPRPIISPFITAARGDAQEEGDSTRNLGRDFSGISPYRPGDSLTRIHWKSLARGQGLHVTEFDEENSGGSLFSLERMPGSDLEYKLSCLCHMVLSAASQGLRYGLELGRVRIEPARGERHKQRCLEALALYGILP